MNRILYGLLDDEGNVIRWQDTKPAGDYVTKEIPQEKRKSQYELSAIVGDDPF